MKTLRRLLTVGLVSALVVVAFILYISNSRASDQVAVAATFGQFRAFLLSSNYPAAYQMMSAEFRARNSLVDFENLNHYKPGSGIFTNCDWNLGAFVDFRRHQAQLGIKYNASFGTTFYLQKENGRWSIVDRFGGFEEL